MKNKIYSLYHPAPQIQELNTELSMTQQHFKDECDINRILAKFLKTGFLATVGPGTYDDVSEVGEYRQALHLLEDAKTQFDGMPAAIRKYFDNDPANFMEFCHNPANRDKAIEIGLIPGDLPNIINNSPPNPTE